MHSKLQGYVSVSGQKDRNMARISRDELFRITGRHRPAAQVRWFKKHLAVKIPADESGPILTSAAFEALVAKQCGVQQTSANTPDRPTLKLLKVCHGTS